MQGPRDKAELLRALKGHHFLKLGTNSIPMFVNAKTTKAFDEIFKDALVVLEWIVDLSSLVDTPIPSLFVNHASGATLGEFTETSIPLVK